MDLSRAAIVRSRRSHRRIAARQPSLAQRMIQYTNSTTCLAYPFGVAHSGDRRINVLDRLTSRVPLVYDPPCNSKRYYVDRACTGSHDFPNRMVVEGLQFDGGLIDAGRLSICRSDVVRTLTQILCLPYGGVQRALSTSEGYDLEGYRLR